MAKPPLLKNIANASKKLGKKTVDIISHLEGIPRSPGERFIHYRVGFKENSINARIDYDTYNKSLSVDYAKGETHNLTREDGIAIVNSLRRKFPEATKITGFFRREKTQDYFTFKFAKDNRKLDE